MNEPYNEIPKLNIFNMIVSYFGKPEKSQEIMYKPLPIYLTIKPSEIDGLGLFSIQDIDNNFRIGITHIMDTRFEDGYIRTPLGGFFNHSENPNCKVVHEGEYIFLETIKEIKAGDELTAKYTLYNPTKK